MNQIDFSTYLFRCSSLKYLMTDPKSKTYDEEVFEGLKSGVLSPKVFGCTPASLKAIQGAKNFLEYSLSATTKSYLRELWIEEVWGRKKVITSGPMEKGTEVESDTMDLFQSVSGRAYFKNADELHNDYIKGTPDIVDVKKDMKVHDTKSSWDMWTFMAVDEAIARADYYSQVHGYMWLAGPLAGLDHLDSGSLIYGLVNTPEHIMAGEVSKLSWRMSQEEAEEIVRRNHTFDDIPEADRIKQFHFQFDTEYHDKLITRILLARKYLASLSLNGAV